MKTNRLIFAVSIVCILAFLCACAANNGKAPPPDQAPASLTITFDYEKQTGRASNQFAIWVEDVDGNIVKTLYATRFVATGGYKSRPDAIPLWVKKSNVASMKSPEIDIITGATPQTGTLSYVWDLTDFNGGAVPAGTYRFFVEGSLRWKNRVLYSGTVTINDTPSTIQADAEYFYETSSDQPALTGDAPERAMIGAVVASFQPARAAE